ncbi:MAG: D-TA family PLP-dependent enzyme [Dysgonamonadaceae bacterium]|jgi:D-serine deaminase-like pyridoxal phosphate-dependent protein|nr:D-TA family PLP-dependent enzyme [Dysgonamonadaceae bacterium]
MFTINNIDAIDSPALIIDLQKVRNNILLAKEIAGDVTRLRPHAKTNKITEVNKMMIEEGISKFKCATIAEAEMLAQAGASDVLLAYQPVGPKIDRWLNLVKTYPATRWACLVDNKKSAGAIDVAADRSSSTLNVFIDINIGMNRTGVHPSEAVDLAKYILAKNHLRLAGLHGYDGHIHDTGRQQRQQAADVSFALFDKASQAINSLSNNRLIAVLGGTPTFPVHVRRQNVECSPGTFVFWDEGYRRLFPDLLFQCAACIVGRVISVINNHLLCVDIGYKSVASENPLPRIYFPDTPEIKPVAHSEEHLVVEVPDSRYYPAGSVLYGIPEHICPTVALYEKVFVVSGNNIKTSWKVIARDRCINI